jgi:hypothetical protein
VLHTAAGRFADKAGNSRTFTASVPVAGGLLCQPRPDMHPDSPENRTAVREGKYTNCFQIGHNAFEFLLEFGQSYSDQAEFMHTRLVTSPLYAARLSQLLTEALTQYETRFGPISLEGEPK